MSKKLYPVRVTSDVYDIGFHAPLRVAKAIKQTEADVARLGDHKRQLPLTWERRHSDRKVTWWGFLEDKLVVRLPDRV